MKEYRVKYVDKVPFGVAGIALYPIAIYIHNDHKDNEKMLRHEKIHVAQQREMWYLLFYIIYLLELGIRILWYWSRSKAYRNISFEREAYANENDLKYLEKRKAWSWVKYLRK